MRAIGRILGRLIVVAVSYVIACVAAGFMVAGSYIVRAWMEGPIDVPQGQLLVETLFVSGWVAAFVSVYAFAPAVLAAIIAEVFAIRRALYYAICGGLAGPLGYAAFLGIGRAETVPRLGTDFLLVAAAGIVAGLVYWLVGGRSAGALGRPVA